LESEETHRVLLELVATGARIETSIGALGRRLDDHVSADQHAFNLLRSESATLRDSVNLQLEEHAKSRNARLDAQDKTLEEIKTVVDRSKGAWWMIGVIFAVFTTLAGLVLGFIRPQH